MHLVLPASRKRYVHVCSFIDIINICLKVGVNKQALAPHPTHTRALLQQHIGSPHPCMHVRAHTAFPGRFQNTVKFYLCMFLPPWWIVSVFRAVT